MKNVLVAILAVVSLGFVGCNKIKEVKTLGDNLSNLAESAKSFESIGMNEESADPVEFSMSEDEVRDFYSAVEDLSKKYPDVYFEVPYSALVQAMDEGINLKKVVEAETKYSFDDFNKTSTVLLAIRTQGIGSDILAGIDEGFTELDGIDLSGLEGEDKAAAEAKLAETRKEMEEAQSELDSDEMKKITTAYDMIMRVRSEFDLPE